MARDATDTRETLLRTAQQMFARDGIHQVPLKRIVETAGQRNASALHYHFGGRDGLLVAITERHDGAIENERAELLSAARRGGEARRSACARRSARRSRSRTSSPRPTGASTCASSSSSSGSSTSGTSTSPGVPPARSRCCCTSRAASDDLPPPVRHERVTILLALVSETLAMRARALEDGPEPALDHDAFVANLVDMAVGALSARGLRDEPHPRTSKVTRSSTARVCSSPRPREPGSGSRPRSAAGRGRASRDQRQARAAAR